MGRARARADPPHQILASNLCEMSIRSRNADPDRLIHNLPERVRYAGGVRSAWRASSLSLARRQAFRPSSRAQYSEKAGRFSIDPI